MITMTFTDVVQLFFLGTISFAVNGLLGFKVYHEWLYRKSAKNLKFVMSSGLGVQPLPEAPTAQPNAPTGTNPSRMYL